MLHCKVCKNETISLLKLNNMPAISQNFRDKDTIYMDKGILLNISQCKCCGLVQLKDAAPVPYNKDVIRSSNVSQEMRQFRLKQFSEFIKRYDLEDKQILEVGCGNGEYLSLMMQYNQNTDGIENNIKSVLECRKNGLNAYHDYINSENSKLSKQYDAFYMLSFLEHVPNINGMLRGIANNLKDDGIGLIEVPNFDMILRNKLFSEFVIDHLYYFTQETLRSTLNLNGFEVLECNEIWHNYIISAVVKKRKVLDLNPLMEQKEHFKSQLHKVLKKYKDKEVAVWGAGHQALAVLAMTDIKSKIKYVIDSAPFKQYKCTPSTHLFIVPPIFLKNDPPKAILLLAGSYNDEIKRLLKDYDTDIIDWRDFDAKVKSK